VTVAAADASPGIGRRERFASVGSTNDVVRGWLRAGEPEICVAVADEQTAGRGRAGRTWTAPSGTGLLVSLGFRPAWLAPDAVWRIAATASLAMAEAAEASAGLAPGTVQLKWPNDLVVVTDPTGRAGASASGSRSAQAVRKVGGVLGETDGLGSVNPTAIVGIGLNVDWQTVDFPADLASSMTSLRAMSGDGPVGPSVVLTSFLTRLEKRVAELHAGRFDDLAWMSRQVTTDREIDVTMPDGVTHRLVALGVDAATGALRVAAPGAREEESLFVGEIRHVRLAAV
jgi:BirA family transcriptional regulator, biotin operon repressor / biotin---[acetyl-CoA-carboxylase] ligase